MAPIKRKGGAADESTSHAQNSSKKHPNPDTRPQKRQRSDTDKPAAAPAKPVVSTLLKDDEPSFPRGGASVLTPLEHKQIQIDAARDVLFEQNGSAKAKRGPKDEEDLFGAEPDESTPKKRKSKAKSKKEKTSTEQQEEEVRIEGLSYKRIIPGSMVLGQVTQINADDIALALPNNLTGYVPLTAISDKVTKRVEALLNEDEDESGDEDETNDKEVDLKSFFHIGQYLRAYVTSTGDAGATKPRSRKHLELSVDPRHANSGLSKNDLVVNSMVQASVVSVEDHGLVMDLGIGDEGVRGFISSNEVGQDIEYSRIEEGSVLLCLVTGLSSNGQILKLSADPQKGGNLKKSHYLSDAPTIDSFLPGTAVEVLVADVTASGFAGKIMGMLDCTADLVHSGAAGAKEIEKKIKVGSKIKGRIICTFPTREPKKLGLSLLDHVMRLASPISTDSKGKRSPLDDLAISSIVDAAKVVKVEPSVGVFVDVGVKGVPAFVHISRVTDGKIEALSETTGAFKVGSTHPARILDYNPMDGMFIASMEPKVLSQPFLRIEDVTVGTVVKCKVEKLIVNAKGVGGVLVNLAEGISGLVPEMHMADVHLQHPEKKFKEGMPVTARVLSTDPSKRQIRLTLKKSLVNSEDAIWTSYDVISVGSRSPGTLINILPTGAVVQFYGPVRGFLPVSEMSEAYIQDPKQHFRVGQVVNVHVLSVDANSQKMTVSCKDPSVFGMAQQSAFKALQVGSMIKGNVSEKSSSDIVVELEGNGLKAMLPLGHLTDGSEQKNNSTMKKIRVGQTLQDLVVIEKLDKKTMLRVSNKPSLVKAGKAKTLLSSYDDVQVGKKYDGFINNITATAVYVRFGGGLTGLIPKRQIPDESLQVPDFGFRRDQSISATVIALDEKERRFLLSLIPEAAKASTTVPKENVNAPEQAVSNPYDGQSTSMDDYSLGKLTKARIASIKDTQINVQLADNVQGRIDVSEVFNSWEDIKDRKHPLRSLNVKQILPVRVLGVHDARNHRFLPISHRSGRVPVFELSAKPSDQVEGEVESLTLEKVKVGSKWVAFVNNIGDDCLWVNLSPNVRGRVKLIDASNDLSLLDDLEEHFPIGSALKVHVTGVDVANNRLDLSARSGGSSEPLTFSNLSKGMVVPGRVTKVNERQIMVQLSENISGPVGLTELTDDYSQANPTTYNKNDIVRVCVVDVEAPNKRVFLSTRPSRVLNSSLPVKDPEISSISQLKVNDVVRGFVKNVANEGLFVSLGPQVTAYVRVSDLSDSYIKDWKSNFQIDQLVKGKVIAVDPLLNHVQMSLKSSIIEKDYKAPIGFNDLQVGQVITGKIRKVEDFGVFIVVDGSANVSGLCHKSEMADQRVADVKKLYDEGDAVKAVVLKVEPEKRRISFGLKASYFEDGSDSEDSDVDGVDGMEGVELEGFGSEDEDEDEDEDMSDEGGVDLNDVKSIESENESDDEHASATEETEDTKSTAKHVQGLSVGGFDWTAGTLDQQDKQDEASSSDEDEKTKKKKRRKPEIKVDRTGDLDAHGPQSVADFERLLLGQPDSSYLWLSYMAFQLQLSEVGKAREIAERALKTINIREQGEKLNVWVALLNLENTYGSDEAVEEVFKRACQYNDAEEIHTRLTSIYIQSGKNQKADELFAATLKKFSQSPSLYINYATFLCSTLGAPTRARALLARATQALPSHTHIDMTAQFALLEFRSPHGDPEYGRTLFEGLLAQWPRRFDLWNVLIDAEIKAAGTSGTSASADGARAGGAGDGTVGAEKEHVRRLFGRVVGVPGLKGKKARFWFKKWMQWEEKNGDGRAVESVRARAAEFAKGLEERKEKGGQGHGEGE
ncbi:MAG: hypothetical protein M1819_000626 [Sarea resinae]|nr:MAG: hypothetical protein M1819_000626 [Sarea resinae]